MGMPLPAQDRAWRPAPLRSASRAFQALAEMPKPPASAPRSPRSTPGGTGTPCRPVQVPGQGEAVGATLEEPWGIGGRPWAGEGQGTFQDPQAVHGPLGAGRTPPAGVVLDRRGIFAAEEIRAQGEDDLGLGEPGQGRQVGAESGAGGLQAGAGGRLPGQVPQPGQGPAQFGHQGLAGGRLQGAGDQQDLAARARAALQACTQQAPRASQVAARTVQARPAQPVRIVQAQHVRHRPGEVLPRRKGCSSLPVMCRGRPFRVFTRTP